MAMDGIGGFFHQSLEVVDVESKVFELFVISAFVICVDRLH